MENPPRNPPERHEDRPLGDTTQKNSLRAVVVTTIAAVAALIAGIRASTTPTKTPKQQGDDVLQWKGWYAAAVIDSLFERVVIESFSPEDQDRITAEIERVAKLRTHQVAVRKFGFPVSLLESRDFQSAKRMYDWVRRLPARNAERATMEEAFYAGMYQELLVSLHSTLREQRASGRLSPVEVLPLHGKGPWWTLDEDGAKHEYIPKRGLYDPKVPRWPSSSRRSR